MLHNKNRNGVILSLLCVLFFSTAGTLPVQKNGALPVSSSVLQMPGVNVPDKQDWVISPETIDQVSKLYWYTPSTTGVITDIAWSPDGSILAVAGNNGLILLDGATLKIIREIDRRVKASKIVFSADGLRLAGVDRSQYSAEVWDVKTGQSLGIFPDGGYAIALNTNGKILAMAQDYPEFDENGYLLPATTAIKIFDVDSGEYRLSMTAKTSVSIWNTNMPETLAMYFSADGLRLHSVTNFGDVRLWDVKNGKHLNTSFNNFTRERLSSGECLTDGRSGSVFAVSCHITYIDPPCTEDDPDCPGTFSTRTDVGLWATDQLRRLQVQTFKDFPGFSPVFGFVPGSNRFALLDMNGNIHIWSTSKHEELSILTSQLFSDYVVKNGSSSKPAVPLMALKPGDGDIRLASASNGNVQMLDESGGVLAAVRNPSETASSAWLMDDGSAQKLAVGISNGSIQIQELPDANPILEIPSAHHGEVIRIRYDVETKHLISAGADGLVNLWDREGRSMGASLSYSFQSNYITRYSGFEFDPGGRYLANQEKFNTIKPSSPIGYRILLWDTSTRQIVKTFEEEGDPGGFSRDGNWMVTRYDTVKLWRLEDGELVREFQVSPDSSRVYASALAPDASLLAMNKENRLLVLDINSQQVLFDLPFDSFPVRLDFSPDGCLLIVGERSGQVSVINVRDGSIVKQWWDHAGTIRELAFSQDGRLILSVGDDGRVVIRGMSGVLGEPPGDALNQACKIGSSPVTSTPRTPTVTFTPAPPTTTPTPVSYSRNLYLTEPRINGNDVYRLQTRLVELGYEAVGEPDGVFGPMTDEAVRAYQQDHDLVVDGIVGPATWNSLFGS